VDAAVTARLDGRRVLVVGASRGIGLAIGEGCAEAGASVVLAARSMDKLEVAAKGLGDTVSAQQCDVRDPAQCAAVVEAAVSTLGGLDVLVYSTGMSIFRRVGELSLDDFRTVFETNTFGASFVTAAALPHLAESRGHAVYLGSESALYEPTPWKGIGAYIASKRALESLVRSFQAEYPEVAFTNYVVGATVTEFGSDDPDGLIAEFIPDWMARGYVHGHLLEPSDHAQLLIEIINLPRRVLVDHVRARVRDADV
jgi:NAD(P)-dependent dehydrogenase (short-subunit alcohol dehydrogenase family)